MENNPVNAVDPTGHASNKATLKSAVPRAIPAGVDINKNIELASAWWHRWNSAVNALWFAYMVREGGPWDYKRQGAAYEDFGNYNYGATGVAAGFGEWTLLNAAGAVQILTNVDNFILGEKRTPMEGVPVLQYPYGDDSRDSAEVKSGVYR